MVFMNGLGPDPLPAKEAEGPPVQIEPVDLSLRSPRENYKTMNIEMKGIRGILDVEMKDIKTQNSLVVDVMGENTVALKNCIKDRTPTYTKIFPIKTLEILKSLEENINETNEKEYIASIRAIIGNKGLKKGLCDIVSTNLLVDFNLHGDREKKRLLDYPKFLHVLFGGTYNENSTDKSFKQELREALRVAKNRFHKEKYLIKKKNQPKENNPKPTSPRGVFQDQVNSLLENL